MPHAAAAVRAHRAGRRRAQILRVEIVERDDGHALRAQLAADVHHRHRIRLRPRAHQAALEGRVELTHAKTARGEREHISLDLGGLGGGHLDVHRVLTSTIGHGSAPTSHATVSPRGTFNGEGRGRSRRGSWTGPNRLARRREGAAASGPTLSLGDGVQPGTVPRCLTRCSYPASSDETDIDTRWGGFKNVFGGEGGFLVHASGGGTVAVSCYGALDSVELPAGESVVVGSGHLVAFDPGIAFTTRKAAIGLMSTVKSGEGFVMQFTGPGTIHTQPRNPEALVTWLTEVLPFARS